MCETESMLCTTYHTGSVEWWSRVISDDKLRMTLSLSLCIDNQLLVGQADTSEEVGHDIIMSRSNY